VITFAQFVIVCGLSGAGKSQTMKDFEDLGFHCVDNLPPRMTLEFVRLCHESGIARLALVLDVRTHGPFGDVLAALDDLRAHDVGFELLFLEATDDAIVRRYSETRRRHPFEDQAHLADAIDAERRDLASLRAQASRIWDTSLLNHAGLKSRIVAAFGTPAGHAALTVHIVAFGYKYGLPLDADLVFDVRFLPNPFYIPELKEMVGTDEPVARYLASIPATGEFLRRVFDLVDFLVPLYIDEGKSRLTIGIGCTGGRHRSVYVGNRLADHFGGRTDTHLTIENRDLVCV
jgi:UPF0042 nucleotide-binding protein